MLPQHPYLLIKPSNNGYGVFANKNFSAGEVICEFHGQLYSREALPQPYDSVEDHYVQIGENLYMGPSGEVDDFFNHSCDPNAGLKITATKTVSVAIKDIPPGQEVTWDYSTTMDEDNREVNGNCGSKNCCGKIRDFKYLPPEIQQKYLTYSTRVYCKKIFSSSEKPRAKLKRTSIQLIDSLTITKNFFPTQELGFAFYAFEKFQTSLNPYSFGRVFGCTWFKYLVVNQPNHY